MTSESTNTLDPSDYSAGSDVSTSGYARTSTGSARLGQLKQAGQRCARQLERLPGRGGHVPSLDKRIVALRPGLPTDEYRLLSAALREVRKFQVQLREHPRVKDVKGQPTPRVIAIARAYVNASDAQFREADIAAFIAGFQEVEALQMDELWALLPSLKYSLLEGAAEERFDLLEITSSLHRAKESQWNDWFEDASTVHQALLADAVYGSMEFESREMYRQSVGELAKCSRRSELDVARTALAMSASVDPSINDERALARRTHVGFFLVAEGLPYLQQELQARLPWKLRLRRFILAYPTAFYLIGVELLTILIVIFLLGGLENLTPIVAGLLLLVLPSTQAAVDFMNSLVTALVRARPLPKLDLSEGIPEDCTTLVAIPTLLLNPKQVRNLVLDLEIRYLANEDPQLYFALVTDSSDSLQETNEQVEIDSNVQLCIQLIESLNERYGSDGRQPFLLLHRHRVYNASEKRWMGWERKRGKLLDLNQLMRGGFDSFPIKIGNHAVLQQVRYVITLDSDTQLPRDSARRLVGTMAHPLNQAVIDPESRMVVEGYGILQPRIGISIDSASRSRLAAIYSGQTGFDIYTRAISDVYQDLFGEGSFTGKGIYEVDAFVDALQQRFPENALLSHDLLEGAYARAGLVSDIELVDDYPSHFSAYSRRKHRWVRGDWQIFRWLLSVVPNYHGRLITNPISLISRWKIVDNLRRSLIEPATLVLFLAGWLYLPGKPAFWTLASILMILLPVYSNLIFTFLHMPFGGPQFRVWAVETAHRFLKEHVIAAFNLVFLLHQALLSIDAIGRSVLRVFITKKRLLEWETAAEAESAVRRKATVDVYLGWSPIIALALGAIVWKLRPEAAPVAWPILGLWALAPVLSAWLNRAPRSKDARINERDGDFLHEQAGRIWKYFQQWSTESTHWLIPDHVCEDGRVAMRLSPTNVGLLLNARIAALHLGLIEIPDFIQQTKQTLSTLDSLEKHHGHLFNWYDIETCKPIQPFFVSTVDSGNLAACLWTLKQAALAFTEQGEVSEEAKRELQSIAEISGRLVRNMDFSFLYNPRKKVLSVGYNTATNQQESACYDLLASESRIASFIAVAKGDVPQKAWFHLGRAHVLREGRRVLLSWTGTMFEYLMPVLWMRHHVGTITDSSIRAAVDIQIRFGRRQRTPWGISESAYISEGDDYGYAPFGVPALGLKVTEPRRLVVAPYASFLALEVSPVAAVRNLRAMARDGWDGKYGLYEAADYRKGAEPELVRSWMAHHLGMSLLAITNVISEEPFRRYFHSTPEVMATELLLHERVPRSALPDPTPDNEPQTEGLISPAHAL